MIKNRQKIVLAGGGTAGHIYPLFEVYKKLKNDRNLVFVFFGSGLELEKKVSRENKVAYQQILSGKFRRHPSLQSFLRNVADFFLFIFGTVQVFFLFWGDRPAMIFSKGGFASLPTVVAAAIWRIPIIVHESDIVPGLANRIASRFATRIATAFPLDVYPLKIRRKAFYAGLPIADGFFDKANMKNGDYILIFGGSQGAKSLNEIVFKNLNKILEIAPVIHLTGADDLKRARDVGSDLPPNLSKKYQPYSFREDMDKLIGGSALVVCRAGANSIFEVAAMNKKAVFVPIPEFVTAHQAVNAQYLKSNQMAEVFTQTQEEADFFKAIKKEYEAKSTVIGRLSFPWSSKVIADAISSELSAENFRKSINKVFLIGIGGVSMRGIASILQKMGKNVFGSDLKTGGHSARNIKKDIDLVVYSSAASRSSAAREEHEQAEKYNIEVIKRSQMIARLLQNKSAISISGMHGKTTSASLVSRILTVAGLDPGYLIGAEPTKFVPTSKYSQNELFIVEACEYDGSFLDFPASFAMITNIEEEHLDYFKGGLPEIIRVFGQFAANVKPGGLIVYNGDDKNVRKVLFDGMGEIKAKQIKTISYGFESERDIRIKSYGSKDEKITFKINNVEIISNIAGRHFAYNCAGSYAICAYLGVSDAAFKKSVESFVGAKGRFEFIGKNGDVPVYYDYGHHPTELGAVFESIKELFPNKRKFFIFEPHQQDRFNRFFEKFHTEISHSGMDVIGILPVYKVAGRDAAAQFTSKDLVDKLSRDGKKAFLFESYDETILFLRKNCRSGDFVITVGATEVWKVSREFIRE